jgi:hypothetical protein
MKSIIVNYLLALGLFSFCLTACHSQSEKEALIGRWKYISITTDTSVFLPVGKDDVLSLNSNQTFEYYLELANKHKTGEWQFKDDALHLSYHQPDTIRVFTLDIISKDHLKFHEGAVVFDLKKAY